MHRWMTVALVLAGCASAERPEAPVAEPREPTCAPVCEDDLCTLLVDEPEAVVDWVVQEGAVEVPVFVEARRVGCLGEVGCDVVIPVPADGLLPLATLAGQTWDLEVLLGAASAPPQTRILVAEDWSSDQGPPPTLAGC